ncbi:MAG: hypothetical protein L3J66_08245 [Bacteroidales bacterium]|nr:hypothetical protein [Bacteroidales bacterium]
MSRTTHFLFIATMTTIVIVVTLLLILKGSSFYNTSIEERFYHPDYQAMKSSGAIGHGLGIAGSLFMFIGVGTYMLRKRAKAFSRWGLLKHWLEFHIFLCTLGPILVLFHTSFKFGGLVSISFWSMVAVFASGVIGRFIYIQIPRTIEGRELSLSEVREMKTDIGGILRNDYKLNEESYSTIVESTKKRVDVYHKNIFIRYTKKYIEDKQNLYKIKSVLKRNKLSRAETRKIVKLVNNEISLNRRIDRLTTMQNLFKHWHVAHLPFAIIMLVIMIIHVIVTLTLGYRWIF